MELVAFLGRDEENWGQISALAKRMKWNNVILIKNKEAGDFPEIENSELIKFDTERPIIELKEDFISKLRNKLKGDFEVALSLASGSGKEHMALISALLSIPVGVRLVVFTKNGVEFLT